MKIKTTRSITTRRKKRVPSNKHICDDLCDISLDKEYKLITDCYPELIPAVHRFARIGEVTVSSFIDERSYLLIRYIFLSHPRDKISLLYRVLNMPHDDFEYMVEKIKEDNRRLGISN